MYKVLKPIYTVVGKVLIKNRNVNLYDISWEKVEPTLEMVDAAREHHEGEAYLPVSLYKAMLAAAPAVQGEPVSAQVRYRRPEKGQPGWSVWQPAAIRLGRPSWEIDSQGWEVEYRLLYAAPHTASKGARC